MYMYVCMYACMHLSSMCVHVCELSVRVHVCHHVCSRAESRDNSSEGVRVEKPSYTDNKQLQQLQELLKQRDDEISNR